MKCTSCKRGKAHLGRRGPLKCNNPHCEFYCQEWDRETIGRDVTILADSPGRVYWIGIDDKEEDPYETGKRFAEAALRDPARLPEMCKQVADNAPFLRSPRLVVENTLHDFVQGVISYVWARPPIER